jgi:hypothetical protein
MEGFVEVIKDNFMSDPENVLDAEGAAGSDGAEGTEDEDGTAGVSEGCGSEPKAGKGEGLRVRRRRW